MTKEKNATHKVAYTRMHTHLRHECKRNNARGMEYKFAKEAENWCIENIRKTGVINDGDYLFAVGLQIDAQVLKGECTHWFLPSLEFCEWLVGCVHEMANEQANIVKESMNGNYGCFHFPTNKKAHSFAFRLHTKGGGMSGNGYSDIKFYDDKENMGQLEISHSVGSPDESVHAAITLDGKNDQKCIGAYSWWCAKLVVGLGLYLNCFPEQKRDGVPENIKHPNQFRKLNAHTITTSHVVVSRSGPSPHYRTGHFRVLKSERYKKKRWQAIFIRGCFVKGRAITVDGIE